MLIKRGGNTPIHVQGCHVYDLDKAGLNRVSNRGYHYDFPSLAAERAKAKAAAEKPSPAPITPQPKKKRMGLFRTLKALYNAPQITGRIYY